MQFYGDKPLSLVETKLGRLKIDFEGLDVHFNFFVLFVVSFMFWTHLVSDIELI